MRILICSQRDLPACVALNQLILALAGREVAVMLCEDLGPARRPLAWLKLFTRELPNEVLFPLLDRCPKAPGQLLTFNHLARAYGVPFHAITQINQGDGYTLVEAFRPDLILSLRFDLIFKSRVIELPRLGILNIHPGVLPRYAGLYAQPQVQDRTQREYRSFPSAEDFMAFEAKGLRLVDPESDWEFLRRFCTGR